MSLGNFRPHLTLLLAFVLLSGCAHRAPYEEVSDPLEPVNRLVYRFNDVLDRKILKPTAKGYQKVVPSPARVGIRNFFSNLKEPLNIVNSLLQGKPANSVSGLMRFTFNSVFGLAGLVDVATGWELPQHREDFGQTLAVWGVGEGWYIVLPLFGPSNVRDALTLPLNWQLDPVLYPKPVIRFPVAALRIVSDRADLLNATRVLDAAALDRYISVREAYRQLRWNAIYDGNPPEPDFFDDELLDQ